MIDPDTRIIFLDIDGVLNHKGYWPTTENNPIDPECVKHLNGIIKNTGAAVVISSSWRNMMDIETITNFLKNKGFVGNIIGETPDLYKPNWYSPPRGCEIQHWIDKNISHTDLILYEKYIIIDDDSDMLLEHANHFIHTTFDHGLTQDLAYRATLTLLSMENVPDF